MDQSNIFGSLYGLKAVPLGIYIDEQGRIVKPPHGISSGNEDALRELERWIAGEDPSFEAGGSGRDATDPNVREADLRFGLGSHLLAQGKQDEAMAEWRRARELDPGNWIIHK